MDVDTIKYILKNSIETVREDYNRSLKLFGGRDPIVNYNEGRLTALEGLLKCIEKN